jgi:ATP-binding protein involved in chromosome partitioning
MFQQLGAPILGMVENMSSDIFGRGGAEMAAQRLNLPFLGAIPLIPELRINSDAGTPSKNFEGDPKLKQALESMISNLAGQISLRNMQPRTPELNIL